MKITLYDLLGMVKDETDKTNINIYVKYFDRVKKRDDIMLACKENIIYKLDNSNIELNDEAEILEEPKGIPEKLTPFEAPFLKGEEPDIRFRLIIDQMNDLIDYLESKGESND